MEKFITDLILEKKKLFIDYPKEMIASYDRELKTISGYNGRQLLELVQNCDDEGSDDVMIRLDSKSKVLSISNNGAAFSKEGYESLFTSDYSSKVNKSYIGNKGLGFRSIINWSSAIEIHSNGIALKYTEENRISAYKEMFDENLHKDFLKKRNFQKHVIPIPFLSLPTISKSLDNAYVTTIYVHYKDEFLESILEQVSNLTHHALLFLRNIKTIHFEGFEGKENIICAREKIENSLNDFGPSEKISFENHCYHIFNDEEQLPQNFSDPDREGIELYQIKIAIEENLKGQSPYLYSFFPTTIRLDQPYILHATFDLDVNRNQINNTFKNKFILGKITDFTIKVAAYYSALDVSYKPLSLLYHHHKADTLNNLGYYDLIDQALMREPIFPCIDGFYRSLGDVINVSSDFAAILLETGGNRIIGNHLLPISNPMLQNSRLIGKVPKNLEIFTDIVSLVNQIGAIDMSVKSRARFISLVVKEAGFIKSRFENQIDFLINNEGKVLKGNDYIFTPSTNNIKFEAPVDANIQFLNEEFFNELTALLGWNSADEKKGKARFVYEQLKGFCHIHSYEPAALAEKIIRYTNNSIRENPAKAVSYIKEMNFCLYHNFKLMSDDTKITDSISSIPAIGRDGAITTTALLVLNEWYPTGKKNNTLFKDIYTNANYIAAPDQLGLDINEDKVILENYLIWIRVNKFAAFTIVTANSYGLEDYVNYVKNYKNFYENKNGYKIKARSINDFELILSKISITNLLLWIYYDQDLRRQLQDSRNIDEYEYIWYGRNYPVANAPSYIKYLINTHFTYKFSDLLLDDKYSWVNDFQIDYKEIIGRDSDITRTAINDILLTLGATDDFNNLPINKVVEIINSLPRKYPTGTKSQTFYKKALVHYETNQIEINSSLQLFADDGGDKVKVFDRENIFFSDRIKLPKRLRKDFPVFYFPSRAGGAEAIKFFGINDLKDLKILLTGQTILDSLTTDMENYVMQLKPVLLANRINSSEDTVFRKNQASLCNKIKIKLSSEIKYQVRNKNYEVSDYEFIHYEDQTYYVKVSPYDTIEKLRKNSIFTASFAEIISLVFDVSSDINDFKYIIRSDFDDVIATVNTDFGNDILNDAKELLGLADYKQAFWKAVLESKGFVYEEQMDDLSLENYLQDSLGLKYDLTRIDYENLTIPSELNKVELLFSTIGLKLENFAAFYSYKISLEEHHKSRISSAVMSEKKRVKSSIWKFLTDKSIEDQAEYLSEINKYEKYAVFVQTASESLKHSFDADTDLIVSHYIAESYPYLTLIDEVDLYSLEIKNLAVFTSDEQWEISQSIRLKSLIYFDNALAAVRSEVAEILKKTEVETSASATNAMSTAAIPQLMEGVSLKPRFPTKAMPSSGVYVPKDKNGRRLKEIGNTSEQVVYEFLIRNNYENADLIARDNEGLHYDIRYTDAEGSVKFVEVKTFDTNSFYMSKEEYDFGYLNKENYEIWLVKNKLHIIAIKDFFTNPKYIKTVNEYIVFLEISNDD